MKRLYKIKDIKFVLSSNKFDKKGEGLLLANKTLEIIIAVICILFLAYIFYSIYANKVNGEEKKQAEGDLTRMKEIIDSLDNGESEIQDIVNPKDWYLISFTGNIIKPNLCINKNCLCICQGKKASKQAEKCDDDGACIVIENLATSGLKIKIIGPDKIKFIRIKKENGLISIGG